MPSHISTENMSLPVDVRHPKTSFLKLHFGNLQIIIIVIIIVAFFRGGSRISFRRGCTRLLLHFNTNKPHSFFCCRVPVVLENRRLSTFKKTFLLATKSDQIPSFEEAGSSPGGTLDFK